MQLTKFYLAGMLKRNEGRILQVTSLLGFIPAPLLAIYGATKAFQANLTDALINEIKDTKVTITQLIPGMTDTGGPLTYFRASTSSLQVFPMCCRFLQ